MKPLVTSARCELLGNHAHVTVWSRGALAGTLVVAAADATELLTRLVPDGIEANDLHGRTVRRALVEAKVERAGYTIAAHQYEDGSVAIMLGIMLGTTLEQTVGWDGERFVGLDLQPTPNESENADARRALETAYAAALAEVL